MYFRVRACFMLFPCEVIDEVRIVPLQRFRAQHITQQFNPVRVEQNSQTGGEIRGRGKFQPSLLLRKQALAEGSNKRSPS